MLTIMAGILKGISSGTITSVSYIRNGMSSRSQCPKGLFYLFVCGYNSPVIQTDTGKNIIITGGVALRGLLMDIIVFLDLYFWSSKPVYAYVPRSFWTTLS